MSSRSVCTSSARTPFPELDETLITDRFAVFAMGCASGNGNHGVLAVRRHTVGAPAVPKSPRFRRWNWRWFIQRNFVRQGFGLNSFQDRDRIEFEARLQNIWRNHTFKYGLS